jgi:catechol 2,3-dioxygenase-like lactoylglutathione lyase family enzyme
MPESFDSLLTQYDAGRLTRRELLAALLVLAAPATSRAQEGVVRGRVLNHINVGVTDVARSETFYRDLLGLPARHYIVGDAFALDFPDGGLISLCPVSGGNCSLTAADPVAGEIDHFGIGIDDFDAPRVASELEAAGFEGVRQAGDTSVFIPDPDGVIVQLSSSTERFEGTPPRQGC